jgi:hypothetical protein
MTRHLSLVPKEGPSGHTATTRRRLTSGQFLISIGIWLLCLACAYWLAFWIALGVRGCVLSCIQLAETADAGSGMSAHWAENFNLEQALVWAVPVTLVLMWLFRRTIREMTRVSD